MKKFLIIYSSDNTAPIISRIKTFGNWVHIKNRVWCISTNLTSAIEVRDCFQNVINNPEQLMVIDITYSNWAAINIPMDAVCWLKEN